VGTGSPRPNSKVARCEKLKSRTGKEKAISTSEGSRGKGKGEDIKNQDDREAPAPIGQPAGRDYQKAAGFWKGKVLSLKTKGGKTKGRGGKSGSATERVKGGDAVD